MNERVEYTLPDVQVAHEGTIYLVRPVSDAAKQWIADHVRGEVTWFGPSLVVEHRYVVDLTEGMRAAGLVVE